MTFDEGDSSAETDSTEYTFRDLFPARQYTFTVAALNSDNETVAEEKVTEQPKLSPAKRRTRSSSNVSASRIAVNGNTDLRSAIGESCNGYSVMQGGCTDGTNAYYLMVSSYNQHARVVKVNMASRKIVKVSGVVNVWHGNGMTYDSRRHQLVVNARDESDKNVYRRQELTCIDADTLQVIPERQRNVKYSNFANDNLYFTPTSRSKGLGNVSYNEKYDVYIAIQRDYHNYILFDPDTFEAIGLIMTRVNKVYPGTYQAMDCDDQYIYQLLSAEGSSQPHNLILALDWNSDRLLDENGYRQKTVFIDDLDNVWTCTNNRKPVAVYRINTPYEAENIYHTTDSAGRTYFYLSEYNQNRKIITKSYQQAYKVKWKKVKKKVKVKVKWKKVKKKVKVKGKWKTKKVWKYKYKWKKKKVWKYKTKYRTVYYNAGSYRDRLAHIYYLGVI